MGSDMQRSILGTALTAGLFFGACREVAPQKPASAQPAPKAASAAAPSADTRLDWWREARFGMFIHWGLYSIPAGQWGDRTDHGEWIRTTAQIPVEEYEQFQKQFNPVKFDADAWARTAKDAGMKYLVITSKHHDGFCLFDSAYTDWDVMNTPFHRDILKELSEACARQGIRFCTYHSIMDWHHPDYLPRREWEQRSTDGADFKRFVAYLHNQVTEVITKYHPGVLWFDGEWENTWTHEEGVALYEMCRSLDPNLIINNRVDVHRGGMSGFSQSGEAVGDFGTPEQEIPATGMPGADWETCMTLNDHWGYNSHDQHWKSSHDLIRMLVDIASKGGNFLLNVGPTSEGLIPEASIERLYAMGHWLALNGEAIHGTNASPFDALEWGRCTMKTHGNDTTLYLHVFDWPDDGVIMLRGLGNEPKSARLLAAPNTALQVRRVDSDVRIALPAQAPDDVCSVIALEIAGKPIVYRTPKIEADSGTFVNALEVHVTTPGDALEIRYTLDGSEPTHASPLANAALKLDKTSVVSARAFHGGKAVSATARRSFERVAPRAAQTPSHTEPGLKCEHFEGNWDVLPDFDALHASSSEVVEQVGLGGGRKGERLALRFSGFLEVRRDEVYVFALSSDDGSDLWIDDERVVDNDGLHGSAEKRGSAALAAGKHAVRVGWFNKTGGAELALKFAAIGGEPREAAAAALSHAP
jgi:alpha-L-fucosidase